jgi:serine/threonine-protein kinase
MKKAYAFVSPLTFDASQRDKTYTSRNGMDVLRIGRYRILQRLGGGGSSDVYVAEDRLLGRKVALKILRRRESDEGQMRRFHREARSASMLNHPNVVTIFDVGRDGDVDYIATEVVQGETLRDRLHRGPMTIVEAIDVAIAVAKGLAAAHEAWLVHRDIKPENIAIRPDGLVKVLDFGVSALAGDGDATDPLCRDSLVGTLHYLSPEQVRGEPIIDTRSDIYSLGVVMYEMLGQRVPFSGRNVLDVLAAIVEAEPQPLPGLVPAPLRELVMRSLAKSMYQRPQTAAEVSASLAEIRLELALRQRGATA